MPEHRESQLKASEHKYITRVRSHSQAKLFLFGSVANSEEKKNVLNVDSECRSAQKCSL